LELEKVRRMYQRPEVTAVKVDFLVSMGPPSSPIMKRPDTPSYKPDNGSNHPFGGSKPKYK